MSTDKLTQSARAVLDAWGDAGWTPAFDAARQALRAEVEAAEALAAVPVELHYRGVPQGWIDGALTSIEWAISSWRSDEARDAVRAYLGTALAHPAPQPKRCPYCDDTGDVHSADGEWRGVCTCPAGPAPQPQQADAAYSLGKAKEALERLACRQHTSDCDGLVSVVRKYLAATPPQPTAPQRAQAVPAGFSLRRQEDGRIVVKAPIGWCIVANTGQASGIDSMILWSLADAMLTESAAQKEPT